MNETETPEPPRVVRKFYPAEIAVFVKASRDLRHLTQADLAEMAHVEVRTVQRLEKAETVSDDTLRRICRALEIDERFLTMAHAILSDAELKRQAEEEDKKFWTLSAQELATADELVGFLGGVDGFVPGHEPVEGELRQAVADCLDSIGEIMSVVGQLGHGERLQLSDGVAVLLKHVQAGGLHLVVAQHTLKLKQPEGQPLVWRMGYVQLLKPKMLRIRRDIKLSF